MNTVFKIPLYIIELFTSAKSFKDNPIIGSALLNKCGLHVVRVVLSHTMMRFRMLLLSKSIPAEDRRHYFEYGYIVKENFLPREDFAEIKKQARSFTGEVREARQGDTITQRAALSPDVLQKYPKINDFLFSKSIQQLMRFTSGHLRDPLYYIEEVKNRYRKGGVDPQKLFHHDTFHPSMKCWLFLDDVHENTGAFTYIPQSQKLNWKRIKLAYKMSINASKNKSVMHALGSMRFNEDELNELKLPPPIEFSVKKNTLLIVNVFGIHRRGDSEEKSTRLALWGDSRTNPFIPFPGIGGKLVNDWQYYFLGLYRKSADDKALKRGGRSPWAVVPDDKK